MATAIPVIASAIIGVVLQSMMAPDGTPVYDDRAKDLNNRTLERLRVWRLFWQSGGGRDLDLKQIEEALAFFPASSTPRPRLASAREVYRARARYVEVRRKLIERTNYHHVGAKLKVHEELDIAEAQAVANAVLTGVRMERNRVDQWRAFRNDHRFRVTQHLRGLQAESNAASNAALAAAKASGVINANRSESQGYLLSRLLMGQDQSGKTLVDRAATWFGTQVNQTRMAGLPDQSASETARLGLGPPPDQSAAETSRLNNSSVYSAPASEPAPLQVTTTVSDGYGGAFIGEGGASFSP